MMVQANIFSGPDLIIVALIILVLFGGKKIPELARGLGEGIKNFKDATKEGSKEDAPAPVAAPPATTSAAAETKPADPATPPAH